jgi:hypothetical protein
MPHVRYILEEIVMYNTYSKIILHGKEKTYRPENNRIPLPSPIKPVCMGNNKKKGLQIKPSDHL